MGNRYLRQGDRALWLNMRTVGALLIGWGIIIATPFLLEASVQLWGLFSEGLIAIYFFPVRLLGEGYITYLGDGIARPTSAGRWIIFVFYCLLYGLAVLLAKKLSK